LPGQAVQQLGRCGARDLVTACDQPRPSEGSRCLGAVATWQPTLVLTFDYNGALIRLE
jgi:hypothetical protein